MVTTKEILVVAIPGTHLLVQWIRADGSIQCECTYARPHHAELIGALQELVLNANRLCDRQLGGTYEEDCRRSLERARTALTALTDAEKRP